MFLLSNAIKFTHEGKVGIKLYVIAEPSPLVKKDPTRGWLLIIQRFQQRYGRRITVHRHLTTPLFEKALVDAKTSMVRMKVGPMGGTIIQNKMELQLKMKWLILTSKKQLCGYVVMFTTLGLEYQVLCYDGQKFDIRKTSLMIKG